MFPRFGAAFLLIAVSSTFVLAATDGDVRVLAVDRVGQVAGLDPAGDVLSVSLHHEITGDWLRVSFVSVAGDLAGVVAGDGVASRPASIPLRIEAATASGTEVLVDSALRRTTTSYGVDSHSGLTMRVGDPDAVWLALPVLLATPTTVFTVTTLPCEVVRTTAGARAYAANCALVLGAASGIADADAFHVRNADGGYSGLDEALRVHEAARVPGNFHVSGPLQTAAAWAAAGGATRDFNAWLAAGVKAGWADIVTSAYALPIMPFLPNALNDLAVSTETRMAAWRYGATPTVGWVPRGVWLSRGEYPSRGVLDDIADNWLPYGVRAVIVDADVHLRGHDVHRISTLASNGLRLVPRDPAFSRAIVGGDGRTALGIVAALASDGAGAGRLAVMAANWSSVAGIGDEAAATPRAGEAYAWFVAKCAAERAWLTTWKLSEAVANPAFAGDTISITPGAATEFGGVGGYGGSDNLWYARWSAWVPYATGGDGHGDCAGHSGNCKSFGALKDDAYRALRAAPDNTISRAGWYVLMSSLRETGWQDGELDGRLFRDASHLKQVMIYAAAARWADGQSKTTTAAYATDIDGDGTPEVVMHNDRLFAVFEAIGGRCTNLFVKGPGYADTAIGVDTVPWSGTGADVNDDNHVGAFSDVGPNYQHDPYDLRVVRGHGRTVTIRATFAEVTKQISLTEGQPWLEAIYDVGPTYHWVRAGFTPSLVDQIWNARMDRVGQASRAYVGQRDPVTGVTVAWVLGQAGAGYQGDFAAMLMRGDELKLWGVTAVRLYAGVTSAPESAGVTELQSLADGFVDTIGPRPVAALWHPIRRVLEVTFDQPIVESTFEPSGLSFDADGDGIADAVAGAGAEVIPSDDIFRLAVQLDAAHGDALNAHTAEGLRLILDASSIDDTHGVGNPADSAAVQWAAPTSVNIDGRFDAGEWGTYEEYDDGDSEWANENEIASLHVSWDAHYLYLGLQGRVNDNSWLLYLDVDPGSEHGASDLSAIDAWERGTVFTAPGFAADFQYGARQHQTGDDAQSLWRIDSATHAVDISAAAIMAFDPDHVHGDAGGSELAIPWNTLYGLGPRSVPAGARIAVAASLCWDPAPGGMLGGDSVPNNRSAVLPVIDHVLTYDLDLDNDGVPDPLQPTAAVDMPASGVRLDPPYPNPFNPMTTVSFTLPSGAPAAVHLAVFDARGRRVAVLVNDTLAPGRHRATWQGVDTRGRPVAAGTYFCRLVSEGAARTQIMTLVK